jgi:hypothetical protein
MKKSKLMLSIIGVAAVVGAAFAFKAKSYEGNLFCTTVQNSTEQFTQPYTTAVTGPELYCTDIPGGQATIFTTVVAND